jgi:hypothetical protein
MSPNAEEILPVKDKEVFEGDPPLLFADGPV